MNPTEARDVIQTAWLRRPPDERRTLSQAMQFCDEILGDLPSGMSYPRLVILDWVVPLLPADDAPKTCRARPI